MSPQNKRQVTCLTSALRVWVPLVAPAEAAVPVSVPAERPVPLQSLLLRLPGEPHRSGKPRVYLCEWGLTLWWCGRPSPAASLPLSLPLCPPPHPIPLHAVAGHSGKPSSPVALQVFLVLDSDLMPGQRDDFVLGVSSGAAVL